jgi:hypothetical protein
MIDDLLTSSLLYSDDAPHPHDTRCPGLAGLFTREEYDEFMASLPDDDEYE